MACFPCRVLTYLYLAVFNVRLLLSPSQQAYDYQTGSIHLVESLADGRNVTTSFLLFVLCAAAYRLSKSLLPFLKQASCTATSSPTKRRTVTTPVASPSAGIRLDNPSHALLLSFLFLVLPYLPASHFFLTTGVVVAPRLLYLPR